MRAFPAMLVATVLLAACAPAREASRSRTAAPAPAAAAPKRITAGVMGNPHTVYYFLGTSSVIPGVDALQELVGANLAIADPFEALQPQLAETVPSLANGLWQVSPDGRMETTWKLRRDATWHDGVPFTAQDVVFTDQLSRDRELPQFRQPATQNLVESVEAPDPHTVVVKWRAPYFEADQPFGVPLPAHLLQEAAATNKAEFINLDYWSKDFVGTGPYRVREFERGSHIVLEAFAGYVLGRPKIGTIEVRFIPDPNTLLTNVFAGEVELTLGRAFSPDQALDARTRWNDGKIEFGASYIHRVMPQLANPNPPVLAELPFRQALFYAMDRQEMADTIFAGMTSVPRSVLIPNQPQYRELEAGVPQYAFDPRRAAQLIESLGYAKGADGLYALAGQRLPNVELRATGGDDSRLKVFYAIADQWQRAGVGVDILVLTQAQNQDREFRAKRPAMVLTGGVANLGQLSSFISTEAPTAENNYLGTNFGSWANPRYDELYARYLVTLPRPERNQVLAEMLRVLAAEVPIYPILYQVDATAIGNRLSGVSPYAFGPKAWNSHLWDVTR